QFRSELNDAKARGYRLIDISIADGGVFAGVWEKAEGSPPSEARIGLSIGAFTQKIQEMAKYGFRLVDVDGYLEAGETRFAGIWIRNDGRASYAWIDLTSAAYQAKFDEMTSQGFWPVHVDGYWTPTGPRLSAIFEKAGADWVAGHDLTMALYKLR